MALTVDGAFNKFLADTVNLDPEKTKTARSSRNWLFSQIGSFQSDTTFPKSYEEHDIAYGSFARRTKKRPLDDIDLMVCLSAQGAHYNDTGVSGLEITVDPNSNLLPLCYHGTHILNSKIVVNKFLNKLAEVPQYASSDLERDGSAAVLSLKSYDWSFDIVPCFMTTEDANGKTRYLIPDGFGNWKKTDPRIDRDRVIAVNQKHNGNVLNIIRIVKFWNARPTMPSMTSYLLEAMILDYYDDNAVTTTNYVDLEVPHILGHIADAVYSPVLDPKGIQGDINGLDWEEKEKISNRARQDADKAYEAMGLETADPQAAIAKWREIFGPNFPTYG